MVDLKALVAAEKEAQIAYWRAVNASAPTARIRALAQDWQVLSDMLVDAAKAQASKANT
jgi:hypothetical protein